MPLGGDRSDNYNRPNDNPNSNFRRRNDEERGEKEGKVTAMRMTYGGVGEPLILL